MNTLDVFVEKGIKIGQEKSLQGEREKTARNLIKISNLNDEQIATATDLPIDRVISLRKEAQYNACVSNTPATKLLKPANK